MVEAVEMELACLAVRNAVHSKNVKEALVGEAGAKARSSLEDVEAVEADRPALEEAHRWGRGYQIEVAAEDTVVELVADIAVVEVEGMLAVVESFVEEERFSEGSVTGCEVL